MPSVEELGFALPATTREVEEFVASGGWDQPTQIFALVSTETMLAAAPDMAGQLDPAASPLTPLAQESLPAQDLGEALARIEWPEQVIGCALVQEIIVLPPEAEAELPDDEEGAGKLAAEHPDRREARLVAAVLRDDVAHSCVMRLRGEEEDEVFNDPSLAPNLLKALQTTFT
ncbi:PPA1309 family protein [Saccharopolyspora dendranthemae]|uniref:Uncharacterized protein n=1 Tax=Saccharopolyspora dendranthemae TaxID=1181886 RepID=A0A561U1S0_9PSEU|nr:PPA1309 family protein [Saccharopolyspora dendranthemae]TWF93314.1 hypothetical protein FHU35_15154 [Saccharopolyspora dendranthemae]